MNDGWSEHMIARDLALRMFARQHLVVVPNCIWTGYECDLLVVTQNLRIIDVEIKISRADLKADVKKGKWWHHEYSWDYKQPRPEPTQREWPLHVWKHYYAMPAEVWKPEFVEILPKNSGVLLLTRDEHGEVRARCERKSTPNRAAKQLEPKSAIDIARLASLRYWDAVEANHIRQREAA